MTLGWGNFGYKIIAEPAGHLAEAVTGAKGAINGIRGMGHDAFNASKEAAVGHYNAMADFANRKKNNFSDMFYGNGQQFGGPSVAMNIGTTISGVRSKIRKMADSATDAARETIAKGKTKAGKAKDAIKNGATNAKEKTNQTASDAKQAARQAAANTEAAVKNSFFYRKSAAIDAIDRASVDGSLQTKFMNNPDPNASILTRGGGIGFYNKDGFIKDSFMSYRAMGLGAGVAGVGAYALLANQSNGQ